MGLIAVEVWERDDEGTPHLGMEFRLDSTNRSRALLTIGHGNQQAERLIREGITLPNAVMPHAAQIGKEEGILMPAPDPKGNTAFKPSDGLPFLVAILTEFERDNGYVWAYRVKE